MFPALGLTTRKFCMCGDDDFALILSNIMAQYPLFSRVFVVDSSYPFTNTRGVVPTGPPEFVAYCQNAFVTRVVR